MDLFFVVSTETYIFVHILIYAYFILCNFYKTYIFIHIFIKDLFLSPRPSFIYKKKRLIVFFYIFTHILEVHCLSKELNLLLKYRTIGGVNFLNFHIVRYLNIGRVKKEINRVHEETRRAPKVILLLNHNVHWLWPF
jgi:predicted MPP superfamily phosphohydrolase